ncbi:N-acetyltransferase, partial [Listeria monocytogenes]|nr:N-acetyltransferase [Listeria monocytogenes]
TTQTGSYQAIYLYRKFGFEKYVGKTPENWKTVNFQEEKETAWQIIENKIAEHQA